MTTSAPERAVPDLSFMLAHASHVLATRMTAAFAEIGITPRDYCVLYHAASAELTQIELARVSDRDHREVLAELSPATRRVFMDSLAALVGGLLAEPVESERPVRRARQAAG